MSRTAGIIAGILLSLVFSVAVLPSSAHNEIDAQIRAALRGLLRLHGLVWMPLKDTPVLKPPPNTEAAAKAAQGQLPDSEVQSLARDLQKWAVKDDGVVASSDDALGEARPLCAVSALARCF